jgi:catechol 2,3-dioxygenase-like lactoylglutathione lyase family enzyme
MSGTTTPVEPRLNFVTLVVADLDRARRFYLNGLGWTAALDVGGEVVMVHVGEKLVLSLWAESAARAEIGEVVRGGTLPFTLAHNVASPAEVDAVLETARAAGATVYDAEKRDWGGYSGYFTDPDGFRWEIAFNPHPIGGVTLP